MYCEFFFFLKKRKGADAYVTLNLPTNLPDIWLYHITTLQCLNMLYIVPIAISQMSQMVHKKKIKKKKNKKKADK
jgi:hypothetical protein